MGAVVVRWFLVVGGRFAVVPGAVVSLPVVPGILGRAPLAARSRAAVLGVEGRVPAAAGVGTTSRPCAGGRAAAPSALGCFPALGSSAGGVPEGTGCVAVVLRPRAAPSALGWSGAAVLGVVVGAVVVGRSLGVKGRAPSIAGCLPLAARSPAAVPGVWRGAAVLGRSLAAGPGVR